jgi:integrase
MKLTMSEVRKFELSRDQIEAIVFDDDVPGFGLRVREGGSRTFVFQYKLGNKQRRITLGAVKALDIGKARDTAKDLYAKVRLGGDPAGEKEHAKLKAGETFEAVLESYLEHKRGELRELSYAGVERHLRSHAKPLHRMQFEKITRRDVASCIAAIKPHKRFGTSGTVTRNRVRASLSGFFAWAIGEGLIESNPVVGTNRAEEKARERVLEPAEIRVIWNALEDDHYGAIMKLLALLGQREAEIAGLRLSEIWEVEMVTLQEIDGVRLYDVKEVRVIPPSELADFGWTEVKDGKHRPKLRGPAIVLPPDRTKNKRRHLVPLPDPAREIIAAWATKPRRADKEPADLIFGYGKGPFSGWSNSTGALDERIAEKAKRRLPHWTPHDLRRAFSTYAHELGVEPHIVEAVINHISGHRGGVAGTYNRARYEPAKRAALVRWANHLTALVEGRESNVTPIRRRRE